eukprot:414131-Pyramimonas_sp.AAC.1
MDIDIEWKSQDYRVVPFPRSAPQSRDGLMICVDLDMFGSDPIVCKRTWLQGKLGGIRIRCGKGRHERDLYLLSGNAPFSVQPGQK